MKRKSWSVSNLDPFEERNISGPQFASDLEKRALLYINSRIQLDYIGRERASPKRQSPESPSPKSQSPKRPSPKRQRPKISVAETTCLRNARRRIGAQFPKRISPKNPVAETSLIETTSPKQRRRNRVAEFASPKRPVVYDPFFQR